MGNVKCRNTSRSLLPIPVFSSVSGTSYSINNLNQYPTVGGVGATYDGNGNLASYNGWSYTYDSMNRLTTVTNGTTSANFFYDGLNRQVLRSVGGVGNFYPVWDGWDMYTEYTTGNAWSRNTIHGAPGDLVTQSKSGVTTTYYFPDGLGSTTYLGSGAGALLEQYTYDAHGTPTFYNAGGSVISASAYSVDHLFTGRQWYPTLGFYDLRNRAYLPSIGRFLQPDPIGFAGDPANLYRYCGNNPANLSDSSGLVAGWDDAALFVGGGIVGVIGQGVHDLVAGSAPTWQSYTAAFIGGGIGGVALEYGGPVAAGGLGAITTDMVRQELNLMTGQQQTYDPMQTLVNTGVGMALGTVPGPHSDRNSNQALAKQILTKVENGTIKRITPKTGFKVAHGLLKGSNALSGTITGTLFATALPYNGIGGENQTDGDIPEIPVTETVDSNGNIVQQTIDDPKNAISTDH